jgi:hypothetical protein
MPTSFTNMPPRRRLHCRLQYTGLFVLLSTWMVANLVALVSTAWADDAKLPPRPKRADTFLGMHFDFHAGPDCKEIGKNTTREMIESIIDQVHPDYLQCDCKGHPGLSSYLTQVGNQAPGFVGDPLRIWRQVTAERGVSLYMHYSGIWDSEAIRKHPEWAAIKADGKQSDNATSPFGPYVDQLLIPQLRELAGVYGVDGAWVDGECWATTCDYGEAALKAFQETTGIQDVPRKAGDPHWFEFREFNREAFRKYLRHYITEVKKTNPNFEICSNWAFTDHMPEPVSAPVDFLSGDYSPENSVNSARLSGRYLMRQAKGWDLMAWSFAHLPDKDRKQSVQKSAPQLEREAAIVVALGGGFQAYFKQKRDGSISPEQMPVMAEVAKFCRARQSLCHHCEGVPQVALLYSTAAHYRAIGGLFSRDDQSQIAGNLQALLDGQQSVELLGEHHLTGRMAEYPLIVVPEWQYLEPKFQEELTAYVKNGGNLLLIGPRSAALFEKELGVTLKDKPKTNDSLSLAFNPQALNTNNSNSEITAAIKGQYQAAELGTNAKPFGKLREGADAALPTLPAASIADLGKGKIAATYFTFSRGYSKENSAGARQFLNDLVKQLFPNPMVEVQGSSDVDVSIARNHGKLLVNLVNMSGPHQTAPIIESIEPTGPVHVSIRLPAKPSKVTLEPESQPLPFTFEDGKVKVTVPKVDIHEIIVLEPQ